VIPASVEVIPAMTEIGRSPYGDISLASDEVACEGARHDDRRPYGSLSLASDEVACGGSRHGGKSPYGEPSLLPDIEHDCSRMSGSELRQTRQCLENDSAYSHLEEGAARVCLRQIF
jgi:hypothetical protein